MALKVKNLRGVPIVRTGTWFASTGPVTITAEDLEDAVRAQSDPEIDEAVLKPGHTGPLRDLLLGMGDAAPGIGWPKNLRVEEHPEGGHQLIGDVVGVPEPLAEVMPLAFRRRSAELSWGVTTPSGNRYRMVLTGLALLGQFNPAVKGLEPIEDLEGVFKLYGLEGEGLDASALSETLALVRRTVGVHAPTGSALSAASQNVIEIEDVPTTRLAAVNLDRVRDAWRDEYPFDADKPETDRWVREVWLEPGTSGGFLIVEGGPELAPDEVQRQTWEIDDAGDVTFGTPETVKVTYTSAQLAARRTISELVTAGKLDPAARKSLLSAINPSPSPEPPDNEGANPHGTQEGPMDTEARLRKLLDEEDDAAATKQLEELRREAKTAATSGAQATATGTETTPPATPAATGKPEEKPAATGTETETTPPATPTPGTVVLSEGQWKEVQDRLTRGDSAFDVVRRTEIDGVLRTALSEGRIAPADVDDRAAAPADPEKGTAATEAKTGWRTRLTKDFEGTKSLLSSLTPAFPTSELGADDGLPVEIDEAPWDNFHESVFGEKLGGN